MKRLLFSLSLFTVLSLVSMDEETKKKFQQLEGQLSAEQLKHLQALVEEGERLAEKLEELINKNNARLKAYELEDQSKKPNATQ